MFSSKCFFCYPMSRQILNHLLMHAGHALKINIQTRFLNLSACSWSPYLWNYPYDVHWDALFTFWRRPLQECDTANLDQLMVSHVIMSETCTPYRSNAERRYCPDFPRPIREFLTSTPLPPRPTHDSYPLLS